MIHRTVNIGIIGSRSRDSEEDFCKTEFEFCKLVAEIFGKGVNDLYEEVYVVSGGANKGGDRFAQIIAKKYSFPLITYYPNLALGGNACYFFRNNIIVNKCDYMIAVIDPNSSTVGALSTLNRFKEIVKDEKFYRVI